MARSREHRVIPIDARDAALQRLADAYDRYAELEQRLIGEGRYTEAEGAHVVATRVLRAYTAELRNPAPAGLRR